MTFSRLVLPVMGALLLVTGATVVNADPASDTALAEAVKAKLVEKDPDFLRGGQIEVSGGIVTLKGLSYSPTAIAKALQVSSSVPGVLRVVNRAVVHN
jgi:osmotically-inducible protein OsmY